jgi:hypothetical protein
VLAHLGHAPRPQLLTDFFWIDPSMRVGIGPVFVLYFCCCFCYLIFVLFLARSVCVAQGGLKLSILLPQTSKWKDWRCGSSSTDIVYFVKELRAYMYSKMYKCMFIA